MEPLFTVKNEYTFEKYLKFSREVAKRYNKLLAKVIGMEAIAVFFVIFFFKSNFNLASVFFFFAVVFPISILYEQKRNSKKVWETNKMAQNSLYTYEFYEDHMVRSTPQANSSIDYDSLYDVIVTEDNVYIMISSNQGFMMDRFEGDRGLIDLLGRYSIKK